MNNKEKIRNIISKSHCGITPKRILEKIKDVNKTTIYRNLEKLVKSGEFIEDFTKDGEKIYLLKKEHHHHFICDKCGKETDIGCFLENNISNIESKFGFKVGNHSLTLRGMCKVCLCC